MRLVADAGKIRDNAAAMVRMCGERGVRLAAVTKCVCGEPDIVRAILAGGVEQLADSRLSNVRRMRAAGIDAPVLLLRLPLPDEAADVVRLTQCSINSEEVTLRALSAAAVAQGTSHDVLIMVESGDRREGVMPERVEPLCRLVLELPGLDLAGLATSFNCLCGVLPTVASQQRFADLATVTETALGLRFRSVSAGHTNNVRFVLDGTMAQRVDHLRVGEAILFGTDELSDIVLPVPHHDTFHAYARVIEVQDKPSAPEGPVGKDAFNRVHEWPDLGIRRRAILELGEIDLSIDDLAPVRPDVTVVGASSDHAVVDVTGAEPPVQVGDELAFDCAYTAAATGWSSVTTRKQVVS
jgi:predicted amino acid racemase